MGIHLPLSGAGKLSFRMKLVLPYFRIHFRELTNRMPGLNVYPAKYLSSSSQASNRAAGTREAMSPPPQVLSTLREPLIKSGFLKGHGF